MMRTAMVVGAMMLLGSVGSSAQESDRRELERQLAETREQVRELERELRDQRRERGGRVSMALPREGRGFSAFMPGRPRLGVVVRTAARASTDSIGAALQAVSPGGPAAKAGLKAGDIVTSFNGQRLAARPNRVSDSEESEPGRRLIDLARDLDDGDTVKIEYRRDKETRTASIVTRDIGPGGFAFGFSTDSGPFEMGPLPFSGRFPDFMHLEVGPWLDMELATLNPDLGNYFGTTEGLLVVQAPKEGSLGLKGGDVILAIDGRAPATPSQAMRILRSYDEGQAVQFDVMRDKKKVTLNTKIPEMDHTFRRERHQEQ